MRTSAPTAPLVISTARRFLAVGGVALIAVASACSGGERSGVELGSDSCPYWSSDGAQIAFERLHTEGDDVQGEVYVVDAAGRSPRRLTYTTEWESVLGWNPRLSEVVFDRSERSEEEGEFLSLTGIYAKAVSGQMQERTFGHPPDWPNWWALSPDGQRVVIGLDKPDNIHVQPFVAPVRGGQRVSLPTAYVRVPVWSPDGRRLAYKADDETIVGVTREGRVLGTMRGFDPGGWSPDGRQVAVLYEHDLFASLLDGRRKRRLARNVGDDIAWSADGHAIFYSRDDIVRSVRVDGARDRLIAKTAGDYVRCLAASPDGRRLALLRVTVVGGGLLPPHDDELVVMNTDGTGVRVVPPPVGSIQRPSVR